MLSSLGNFFLILSMVCSGLAVIMALICIRHCKSIKWLWLLRKDSPMRLSLSQKFAPDDEVPSSIPAIFFHLSAICILLAFLTLIYGFVTSDFSLQNVFFNSSTLKPLIFKIAASWASHESSILLWLCLLQIIGSFYIFQARYYSKKSIAKLQSSQLLAHSGAINPKHLCGQASIEMPLPYRNTISIITLSIIYILFASFIYLTSNPFTVLSFKPIEGLGLNPMLQDIALVIHPPLLYLGYVSYSIPFVIACKILWTANINQIELKLLKKFANLGILFLSTGVTLGSWWAYRELGWGGFWFFDPVENISLLPWLSGIALHHCVLMTIKSDKMQDLTITLSIITFLLAIFGTFLVRSGLIDSIHSFASSPKRAIYMLAIFSIIALGSLILLVFRRGNILHYKELLSDEKIVEEREIFQESTPAVLLSRNSVTELSSIDGIFLGTILFLTSLIVLLSSILFPLIYSIIYEESITISEKFFINNFLIFLIPTLLLAGIFTTRQSWRRHIFILILSLILTYISSYKINCGIISVITIIFSLFVMITTLYVFITHFKQKLSVKTVSMLLGHFGFGLLALSITFNSLLQNEIDFVGKIGKKISKGEFEVSLQNIKFASGPNYYRQIAELWVEDKRNNITILKPENRFYIVEKTLSQESDIYSYLTYDLYAVLNKVDGETIHAKIYYRPMISVIWIAALIIINGFLIGILRI